MVTKKTENSGELFLDGRSEIEILKARLEELERAASNTMPKSDGRVDEPIRMEDYIPVMSLLPYNLNLATKEGGQGSVKKFTKFGEIKRVLYRDLVDIIEVHQNFMEAGYFYILDSRVVRQHGLDDIYEKLLTKEKIEEILNTSSENSVELYNGANAQQKEIILELLVGKLRDNLQAVNLNIVDRISRASGVNVVEKAELSRELRTPLESE